MNDTPTYNSSSKDDDASTKKTKHGGSVELHHTARQPTLTTQATERSTSDSTPNFLQKPKQRFTFTYQFRRQRAYKLLLTVFVTPKTRSCSSHKTLLPVLPLVELHFFSLFP
jgi:hypothetical protein